MVPVRARGPAERSVPRKQGVRLHVLEFLQPNTGDLLVQQSRVLWLRCIQLHLGRSQRGTPAVGGCAGRAIMVPVRAHGPAERSVPRKQGVRLHVLEFLQPNTGDFLVQQSRVLWLQSAACRGSKASGCTCSSFCSQTPAISWSSNPECCGCSASTSGAGALRGTGARAAAP